MASKGIIFFFHISSLGAWLLDPTPGSDPLRGHATLIRRGAKTLISSLPISPFQVRRAASISRQDEQPEKQQCGNHQDPSRLQQHRSRRSGAVVATKAEANLENGSVLGILKRRESIEVSGATAVSRSTWSTIYIHARCTRVDEHCRGVGYPIQLRFHTSAPQA